MTDPLERFRRSSELSRRLHEIVPGGAHTYARGDDQYPESMAPVLVRGEGAHVWDADGHRYVEYGMGLRSVTLGHAYAPVLDAVRDVLGQGNNFTRPTELELAAAEDFLAVVPGAEMVKFAKNGSDATTAALRLARAATGRDMVAVADQPFFSTDDWFIASTAMKAGTGDAASRTVRFGYNDLPSVRRLFAEHPGRIAALFLEPATALREPDPGFLEGLRELCSAEGTVLVFDEMITGFRWATGGAQDLYGVVPDLSTWGKAMGNGFPIAALAGRRDLMELGGLRTDAERVFLLSTTHGAEAVGLAAFRAVLAAYRTTDPVARMAASGRRLAREANELIAGAGLTEHLAVAGHPACEVFVTRDADGAPSQPFRTLFLAEMLAAGVLGQSFVLSAAHTDADLDQTLTAIAGALPVYAKAIDRGSVEGLVPGRPVAPAIRATSAPHVRPGNPGLPVSERL